MSSTRYSRIGQTFGCVKKNRPENRTVYVGNKPPVTQEVYFPEKYPDNRVISSKYTVLTFLPKNLFEQFRRVANFYFLCVGIIQLLIDTPVTPITSILPLAFVISVTGIKQGYEDWLRHKSDQEVNNRPATVVRDGKLHEITSMEITVGDIVRVKVNDDFPCDLVMLSSCDPEGTCYIQTANLDGETNLKKHCCVPDTRKFQKDHDLNQLEAFIECQQPITDLYNFTGRINITKGSDTQVRSLGPENVLLRGARLKNTTYIYGCAIYTGQETKMALNSKFKQTKFSRVERSMNRFLLVFLLVLFIEASVCTGLKYWYTATFQRPWYVPAGKDKHTGLHVVEDFLAFMVLFNYVVPISLYVTVEIQKFVGSMFFGWDIEMYDETTNQCAKANTSDLNEELGQVEYLFTDKTGTLTENNMQFRQCSINTVQFEEVGGQLYQRLGIACQNQTVHTLTPEMEEFFTVLVLCHTVRVDHLEGQSRVYNGEDYEYQASSPDEKAFVEACRRYGIVFHGIRDDCMEVTFQKEMRRYRVHHVLEFDPTRKRMSVIIQNEKDEIFLLCKGAESAILDRVISGDKDCTQRHVDEYAVLGLRTLAIAQRRLSIEEFKHFDQKLFEAKTALQKRQEMLAEVIDLLECDFHLLGATAVEDKLQENVPKTIAALRVAGIKVWVLTGDKEETAVNISHSAGHFQQRMVELKLTKIDESLTCARKIQELCLSIEQNQNQDHALIIDGCTLSIALNEYKDKLKALCQKCVAVLCCRMSPIQKAEVVRMIKNSAGKPVTAAIGDGANDVSMIQEADVGLGIMGKEGRQAVRCSDYAFGKFRFLMRALLVHGHFFYIRVSVLVQYFFYKNVAFITCQVYYAFFSSFSEQTLYDSFFLMFYNITFTSLPILIYGLFEQHMKQDVLLEKPQLYRKIARNRKLCWKNFIRWNFLGLWHSLVFFFGVFLVFGDGVSLYPSGKGIGIWSMGTIIYTVCVFAVNIKLALQTYYWSLPVILSYIITVVAFFVMTIFYNVIFWPAWALDYQYMLGVFFSILSSGMVWLTMILLGVIALLPDIILRVYHDMFHVQQIGLKVVADDRNTFCLSFTKRSGKLTISQTNLIED